jgi:hypothetical protein
MKVRGLRRLSVATLPVVLAAAMLGLTTGPASALPKRCNAIMDRIYTDWAYADFYYADAQQAYDRGDFIGGAIYTTWANQYENEADALYDQATGMGCA